jgi:hypothetical protein
VVGIILVVIAGQEWRMDMIAEKSYSRLVDALMEVAENPDTYTPSNHYPHEDDKPVIINLPQKLSTQDIWIPSSGDPRYIIYWDSYENVESEFWSQWFYLDVVLMFLPMEKIPATIGKIGVKVGGKLLIKASLGGFSEVVKFSVGKFISMIRYAGKAMGKAGKKLSFRKEEVMWIDEAGKAWGGTFGEWTKLSKEDIRYLKQAFGDDYGKVIKALRDEGKDMGEFTKSLRNVLPDDVFKGKVVEKEFFDPATQSSVKVGKAFEFSTIKVPKDSSYLIVDKLEKRGLPKEVAKNLRRLIRDKNMRFCMAGGAIGGYFLDAFANGASFDEIDDLGLVGVAGATLFYERDALYTLVPMKGGEKIKGKEFKKVKILGDLSLPPEQWKVYEVIVKDGEVGSKYVGTVSEVEIKNIPKSNLKNCIAGTAIMFALPEALERFDRLGETYKREKTLCSKAVCLKGKTLLPKASQAEKLRKALEANGIKEIRLKDGNHPFYLVSPCFARVELWVANCEKPEEQVECSEEEILAETCERCIFVDLKRESGLELQYLAQGKNYCAASNGMRMATYLVTPPWPNCGYWADVLKFCLGD